MITYKKNKDQHTFTSFIRQPAQLERKQFQKTFDTPKLLSVLSLRMYFSAICIIFCAFYIHSACCGLITEKLKLSQVSEAQCPPEIWTCSTCKRSEIAKVDDISQTVQRRAVKSYPPGIWTRDELQESEQFTDKKDQERSPPRIFVHKNKRMSKQILKTAIKTSQQDGGLVTKVNPSNSCPPGVWTCSTGKRSEVTNEGQVEVLDESF